LKSRLKINFKKSIFCSNSKLNGRKLGFNTPFGDQVEIFLKHTHFSWKWMFLQKQVLTFCAGPRCNAPMRLGPGCVRSAPSNPTLLNEREFYWCYFSIFAFLLPPPTVDFFAPLLLRIFFCRRPSYEVRYISK